MAKAKEADPEDGGMFQVRIAPGTPPSFVANVYGIQASSHSVVLSFAFTAGGPIMVERIAVWTPRAMLGQTVLRERERLRSLMRKWSERPLDGLGTVPPLPEMGFQRVYAANLMGIAISDVGSSIRFHWFPPSEFALNVKKLTAESVIEVRLPGELLSRLWMELDSIVGEDADEGTEADEQAK